MKAVSAYLCFLISYVHDARPGPFPLFSCAVFSWQHLNSTGHDLKPQLNMCVGLCFCCWKSAPKSPFIGTVGLHECKESGSRQTLVLVLEQLPRLPIPRGSHL